MSGKDSDVVVEVVLGTKSFEAQIRNVEKELKLLQRKEKELASLNAILKQGGLQITTKELQIMQKLGITMEEVGDSRAFVKLQEKIEMTNNKLIELKRKQEDLNKVELPETKRIVEDIGSSVNDVSTSTGGLGEKTESVIRKIAKWGLAVFGIRSAYMFIRQSMGVLSQYNDKMASDLEYIRFALASALQPIIETIINLVYKLLAYINYIAQAWFGVNLFANASVKAFKKVNAGVKDTNKSAKELQKTLAGFDEMNILQDNGSTNTGGGGGGVSPLPQMDLSSLENVEIPSWLKWIGENGKLIRDIIIGIGEAFLMWKVLQWASALGVLSSEFNLLGKLLQGAGLAMIIIGIYNAFEDFKSLIDNPSWSTFYSMLGDIGLALEGLGLILLTLNLSNPFGWIALGIGACASLIGVIGGLINEEEEDRVQTLKVVDAKENLKKATNELTDASSKYTNALDNANDSAKALEKAEKKYKISGKELFEQVVMGTLDYEHMTNAQKEVYRAYLKNQSAQENLTKATEEMNDKIYQERQARYEQIGAIWQEQGAHSEYFKTLVEGYRKGEVSADQMVNAIQTALNVMDKNSKSAFVNGLPGDVRGAFKIVQEEVYGGENMFHHYADGVETDLATMGDANYKYANDMSSAIKVGNKSYDSAINKIKEMNKQLNKLPKVVKVEVRTTSSGGPVVSGGRAKGGIYYPPRLATGGIINRPGAGVPYHGAVIGERGAEAVVPLTDSQQMEKLGATIGKYIVVNAQMNNYMNGRLISRELQQIQNEEAFASNGG